MRLVVIRFAKGNTPRRQTKTADVNPLWLWTLKQAMQINNALVVVATDYPRSELVRVNPDSGVLDFLYEDYDSLKNVLAKVESTTGRQFARIVELDALCIGRTMDDVQSHLKRNETHDGIRSYSRGEI